MSQRLVPRRSLLAICAACALAALAFAAVAYAASARFDGETAQDRSMFLKVGQDGLGKVKRASVNWDADCDRENFRFRSRTGFVRPMDFATPEEWRERNRYRLDTEGEFRSKITIRIHGLRVSDDRWKGAFRAVGEVTRNGDPFIRCPTGKVKWSANRA